MYIYIYIYIYIGLVIELSTTVDIPLNKNQTGSINHSFKFDWCPWCNRYRRRKWTRSHEFKSWTRLIAFHIALIPLGKV